MRLIYFQNDISNLVISKLDISKVDISKVDISCVRAHARHGRKLCHVIGMAYHVTHSLRSSDPRSNGYHGAFRFYVPVSYFVH